MLGGKVAIAAIAGAAVGATLLLARRRQRRLSEQAAAPAKRQKSATREMKPPMTVLATPDELFEKVVGWPWGPPSYYTSRLFGVDVRSRTTEGLNPRRTD